MFEILNQGYIMTACTCDSHSTSTTTPALTCTSTDTTTGNAIYASSITTTALKVNGGASSGNAMEITPNSSNANGIYISIGSGFGKCIALNHVGSSGGSCLYLTSGAGSCIYASSTSGTAIAAYANGNSVYAVQGINSSASGYGIRAQANGTTGTALSAVGTGSASYGAYIEGYNGGVYGTLNASSTAGSAIQGTCGIGANLYAGYFTGNVKAASNLNVVGTLTKGGGTFTIDHPSDPKNKILNHSFVESPDMKNVYDGRGIIGSNRKCVVSLPSYFSDLNENFCYQLTGIKSPSGSLFVEIEIQQSNFFVVAGDPGQEFCWQVTGNRKDAFAKANPVIVEVEKDSDDKGYYIHPEVFGLSVEEGTHHRQALKFKFKG